MNTMDQHLHLHQQWELLQHQRLSFFFPSMHHIHKVCNILHTQGGDHTHNVQDHIRMNTMDQHLHLHQQWELLQHQHLSFFFPSMHHIHKVCNILHIQGGDHTHNVLDHVHIHMNTMDQHLHQHQH